MTTPPDDSKAASRTFRSSISVSNEKVCEDEACIGKDVSRPTDRSTTNAPKKKKSPETSMSIGGKAACSDEGCIGKR